MKSLISVVSGTHNRFDLLRGMMTSVRQQMPVGIPYDFVIVDAGSTDGTLDWLRDQPDVTLIEDGKRTGAIDAFTRGAYAATGKYIVLANDDITFWDGSIIKALLHLETAPRCGAVAFADNRESPGKRGHAVMGIGATINGRFRAVNYAQVGMFRKWLGDHLQWWRADGRMVDARTYGGDSGLSACIWEAGYTVDAVDGAAVDDYVADDDLRQSNLAQGAADGRIFTEQWPKGALVADTPQIDNPDREHLRILYLPIYEAGHAQQKLQKRGLREALARRGYIVWEIDYLNIPDMKETLLDTLRKFQPHMMLTQIHGHEPLTADMLGEIRAHHPRMVIVNWNGDYWPHGLTSPEMLKLLRHVHLQTTVNADVLAVYAEHNIAAAYWQIGYEEPLPGPAPRVSAHDVVWLANRHSDRMPLYEALRQMPVDVGIYGAGWPQAEGECLYDFTAGAALYQNAKISIGDNQFPDTVGFVSNRIFQALATPPPAPPHPIGTLRSSDREGRGPALLLHQRVKGLEELTGLCDGVHYVGWTDADDLAIKIAYYTDPENDGERARIARLGTAFVREQHSFDVRVKELFEALLPEARQHIGNTVKVIYRGPLQQVGARGKVTNKQYTFDRDVPLPVDKLDAPYLLEDRKNWVELRVQEGALA